MRRLKRPRRATSDLPGPRELGQIGVYRGKNGPSWYLVTKVGPEGATSGICVHGVFAGPGSFDGLRAKSTYVPDDQVPDEVRVAIATRALLGKVPGGNS
jgi:hypothetical protein